MWGFGLHRELRDGISVLEMHQAGKCRGAECTVAGRRKSEGQRMGDSAWSRGDDEYRLSSVNEVIDGAMGPDKEPNPKCCGGRVHLEQKPR